MSFCGITSYPKIFGLKQQAFITSHNSLYCLGSSSSLDRFDQSLMI